MFAEVFEWLGGDGGRIANFFGITAPAVTSAAAVWAYFRRKARTDQAVNDALYNQVQLQKAEIRRLKDALSTATARLPESVRDLILKERRDGNDGRAHLAAESWLASGRHEIAQILRSEAEWAILHAAGEIHEAGLTVALAYAEAAYAFSPEDSKAGELAAELRAAALAVAVGRPISLVDAKSSLDSADAAQMFGADLADRAIFLIRQARAYHERSQNRLAMLHADVAIPILVEHVGRDRRPTLDARLLRARLSVWTAEEERVLPDLEGVVAAYSKSLGPDDPTTLESRSIQADLMLRLGYLPKAETIIWDVVERANRRPDMGPDHIETLVCRMTLAGVLQALGRGPDALPIVLDVIERQARHPELGPQHHWTLVGRFQHASLLDDLGRPAEGLPIINDVVVGNTQNPDIGPSHANTLQSRSLQAQLLGSLGRASEALPILDDTVARQTESLELGPNHPETLEALHQRARVLNELGRSAEALAVIDQVLDSLSRLPAVGPGSIRLLTYRYQRARVLNDLNRSAEALPIIAEVADMFAEPAWAGPARPGALTSRVLLAKVLEDLGRSDEALTVVADVIERLDPRPDFGPDHRLTLRAKALRARVLGSLGRTFEAQEIIAGVIENQVRSANIGPGHPDTALSRGIEAALKLPSPGADQQVDLASA